MRIKLLCDNLVEWDKASLASDGTIVSSGSFAWSLAAKATPSTEIANGAGTCVDAVYGTWQATIPDSVVNALTESALYYLTVTLTSGSNAGGKRITCRAEYDESDG